MPGALCEWVCRFCLVANRVFPGDTSFSRTHGRAKCFRAAFERGFIFCAAFFLIGLSTCSAYAEELSVESVLKSAQEIGDPNRGVLVFGSAKFACVSCHKVGQHGGKIGPALSKVGKERKPEEIVTSLLHPKKDVKPEYSSHIVITEDGKQQRGYLVRETDDVLTLKEPSSGELIAINKEAIEARKELGTLMPEGLAKAMSEQQRADLIRFLLDLGHDGRVDLTQVDSVLEHALSHAHGPASFEYDRKPLSPEDWPSWKHHVNRDRIYDFYSKQADYFKASEQKPALLSEYPGLDGGELGHWGNQNETTWSDGRWNKTDLGSLQCGVFRGAGKQVIRGMCVRLPNGYSVCFDPDSLTYPVVWKEGFVTFSEVRHGFMHGLRMDGQQVKVQPAVRPEGKKKYLGLFRDGDKVVFHYEIGGVKYLDTPRIVNGTFQPLLVKAEEHVLRSVMSGGKEQWPQRIQTEIKLASKSEEASKPYVVETISVPFENPWNSQLFFGGEAFLPNGSALLCTMQGDVWMVSGIRYPSKVAVWKRFASGLHQAQGMVVDETGIYVLGRDQITRLHDRDGNGEADYYECFSNAYATSPAGHDYICGLQRDEDGYFYTASGNQGVLKISPDGKSVEVLATGFRNPDGLGLTSDGWLTVPCSEGSWTPASQICAVPTSGKLPELHSKIGGHQPPFFGLGGPRNGKAPDLPLVYLPRGLDNSSGGQVEVDSDQWGPLKDTMLHFSFGAGAHFLLLRDEVKGQQQGGIVPLTGEFLSGAHRGRFHPIDGQLYVAGMSGWGSYTPHDGSFQRVRYTGGTVQQPIYFHVHENGVLIRFSDSVDEKIAENVANHFAQSWNYRYSPGYGSAEFSTRHYGTPGHDRLEISNVLVLEEGKTVFFEIPDLQPVNQLHLRVQTETDSARDLFLTIHALDQQFQHPELKPIHKEIAPHPILKDVLYASKVKPNRWTRAIQGARKIDLETGSALTYKTKSIRVKAGEPLRFTLSNPDVVPHNWALIKPDTLHTVGDLANKLIADPDAFVNHYIPDSSDVLFHTDVVQPKGSFTIYFHAPQKPGIYPYLCTFPGHWLVMNGEMIVE